MVKRFIYIALALTVAVPIAQAITIQVKRGPQSTVPAKLKMGELGMATDTHKAYLGYSTGRAELAQRDATFSHISSSAMAGGTGGLPDAPSNGTTYARKNGSWYGLSASATTDATNPANITQSASYRFATDAEKTTWNGKWTTPSNATTLGKITESGGSPLWNGGAWPGASGTTTKAAAYPSTDDNYGVTAAYLEAALNSGFTISTSDATQKGKPAMWDASTGELKAATNGAIASVLPTCSGTDKLTSNGTAISCTADQTSGAGSGITSLNGSTVSSQTFADGANIHVSTNTGTGAHTIGITGTIPDGNIASAATWNAKQSPQTTLAGYGITDAYTRAYLDSAFAGKLDPATAATTYHTKAAFNSYSAAQSVKLATKMNDTSANPDGTHYGLFYNSTAFTGTPSEGMIYTDSAGKLWQYHSGAWVEKAGGGGSYTLPAATASTLGGIMVGSGLAIDGSGVLSAMAGSVNGSGLILAGLTGNQTVKNGFAYIASGNFKATFQNFSSGIATVTSFNNYSGRIVPASGGKFAWSNPVTFSNNTTAAGYSVKVPPNSSVTLQSLGAGTYYATTTRNLVKTGVNEYAGGGGTTYADNFNRADQNPLRNGYDADNTPTGTWATLTGFADGYIYGSVLTTSSSASVMYLTASVAADQYASTTVPASTTGGPAVRINTTTKARYYLSVGSTYIDLKYNNGSTDTTLHTYTTAAKTDSTVYRLEASGTTLTVKVDGAVQSPTVTHSGLATGSIGVNLPAYTTVDNFVGGAL